MTFFQFDAPQPGESYEYPSLGFTAEDGAILDGTASDPVITNAPGPEWSVVASGPESGITRYAQPSFDPDFVEPADGSLLSYSDSGNHGEWTSPADLVDSSHPFGQTLKTAIADQVGNVKGYARPSVGAGFAAALDMESGDLIATVCGDSTGNDDFEWVRKFTQHLADRYPARHVEYTLWDDTSQAYPTPTVIQDGTGYDPGESSVTNVADNFNRTVADLVGTAPQTGNNWQGTAGRFACDGSKMVVNSAGLAWTTGATPNSKQTTTASGVTMNRAGAATVRTLEIGTAVVDAGNHIFASFSVPTGSGLTWSLWKRIGSTATKLADGTTITGNTSLTFDVAVTLDGTTASATISGTGVTTETITGTITSGDATALANGTGCTLWAKNTDSAGTTVDGITVATGSTPASGASLLVRNGSMPGSTLDYQSARLAEMIPEAPDVLILSSGHNYDDTDAATYLTAYAGFVADVLAAYPDTPIIASSQNPEFPDGTTSQRPQADVDAHRARLVALRGEAVAQGWGYIPVYEVFASQANGGRAWVSATDGIHPNYDPDGPNDGSDLWVSSTNAYFDAMSYRTDLSA